MSQYSRGCVRERTVLKEAKYCDGYIEQLLVEVKPLLLVCEPSVNRRVYWKTWTRTPDNGRWTPDKRWKRRTNDGKDGQNDGKDGQTMEKTDKRWKKTDKRWKS